MFKQIMVPLDGSALDEGAIRHAEWLARSSLLPAQHRDATIHLVRVVAPVFMLDPWGIGVCAVLAQDTEAELLRATENLDQLRRCAGGTGIHVRSTSLTSSLTAGVLEYQRQHGVDLVVLASHEQTGSGHLRLGSLLHALLRRGPAPVCVVPPASDPTCLQHVLVPLDGSAGAEQALTLLGQFAPTLVREVTLLRVVDSPDETFAAFRYLSSLRRRPELDQLPTRLKVECGDPAERIIDLGRDHLMVLTKRRHWLPAHGLAESLADQVIRTGEAALLIARQGTHTHRGNGCGARPQHSSRFPTLLPSASKMRYAPAPAWRTSRSSGSDSLAPHAAA